MPRKSAITPVTRTPRRRAAPRETVAGHNLSEMNSSMMRLLKTESLGGNAGRVKLGARYYSCAAANGYADPQSGRIVAFGNLQDISSSIQSENTKFTLRVAYGARGFFKIVELLIEDRGRTLSPAAREALDEYVRAWNTARERRI